MGEKSTTIKFDVSLDENQIPDKITWEASDNSETGDCDAAFLTIWDQKEKKHASHRPLDKGYDDR